MCRWFELLERGCILQEFAAPAQVNWTTFELKQWRATSTTWPWAVSVGRLYIYLRGKSLPEMYGPKVIFNRWVRLTQTQDNELITDKSLVKSPR